MARKSYRDALKAEDYQVVCFRDDAISNPDIEVGVMIAMEFFDGIFSVVRVSWGPEEEWEHPMDGAVEQHWLFMEEETKQLMGRTGTDNGRDLLDALYNRFKDNAHDADYYIEEWCKAEGIDYVFYYHREMTRQTEEKLHKIRKNNL